jgi:Lar family restriction alleviation protein
MKLKPCPFCGGIAAFREIPSVDDVPNAGGQHIECCWCGASTQLRFACGDDPKPLLAESWNRRTDQPFVMLDKPCPSCPDEGGCYTLTGQFKCRAADQQSEAQPPYPFCRHPTKCIAAHRCMSEICCAD